jgi:aminobenzoyl-glutamate utilization protein B
VKRENEALLNWLEEHSGQLSAMCDEIFTHPETGRNEVFAQRLLTGFLREQGFSVELGVGGLSTSFRAVWEYGSGGPAVGLLCEYDALRDFGHGCGHHMQGPAVVAVAAALKETWDGAPVKLVIYGTPDEEYGDGKVTMIKNGCFQDLDFALMTHAGPNTTVDVKSLAMRSAYVRFHGRAAHAAIKPEDGRSAVDALMLAIHGLELLREHVRPDVRLHYAIRRAGQSANVVPDFAEAEFAARSYSSEYLEQVWRRVEKVFRGAAEMTETSVDWELVSDCQSKVPVPRLNRMLMEHAEELDAPQRIPYREQTGSTDFGNVLHQVPGGCIRVAFVPEGTSSHSQAWLDAGMSPTLHHAALLAAKVLALSVWDLAHNSALRREIREEFERSLEQERKEAR